MQQKALYKLIEEDQRSVALSWENFNLGLNEFLVAVRFGEWERAEEQRQAIIINAEVALDGLTRLYRRQESLRD